MTLWVASVSVGVGASQRISFFLLARNPHETRSGRGKEGPRDSGQDRTVSKREQNRSVGR